MKVSEKFHISQRELTEFNNIEDGKLMIGETIIIPGGKISPDRIKTPIIQLKIQQIQLKNTTSSGFTRPIRR